MSSDSSARRVAPQYQEDLPDVRPFVRRFDIEVGHCSQCQRRVQGRHALQTSDALGAAGAQLGKDGRLKPEETDQLRKRLHEQGDRLGELMREDLANRD